MRGVRVGLDNLVRLIAAGSVALVTTAVCMGAADAAPGKGGGPPPHAASTGADDKGGNGEAKRAAAAGAPVGRPDAVARPAAPAQRPEAHHAPSAPEAAKSHAPTRAPKAHVPTKVPKAHVPVKVPDPKPAPAPPAVPPAPGPDPAVWAEEPAPPAGSATGARHGSAPAKPRRHAEGHERPDAMRRAMGRPHGRAAHPEHTPSARAVAGEVGGTFTAAGVTGDPPTPEVAPVDAVRGEDGRGGGQKDDRGQRLFAASSGGRLARSAPTPSTGTPAEPVGFTAAGAGGRGPEGSLVTSTPPRLAPLDLRLTAAATATPTGRAASVAALGAGGTRAPAVVASAPGPVAPAVAVASPAPPTALAPGPTAPASLLAPSLPTGPASMPPVPLLPEGDGGPLLIGLLGLGAIAFRGRRLVRDPKLDVAPLDTRSDLLEFR